jgi:hypothetical protein
VFAGGAAGFMVVVLKVLLEPPVFPLGVVCVVGVVGVVCVGVVFVVGVVGVVFVVGVVGVVFVVGVVGALHCISNGFIAQYALFTWSGASSNLFNKSVCVDGDLHPGNFGYLTQYAF